MADQSSQLVAHATAPLLVGRDRELAILHEALAAALAGRGSLVLIGGEAGIGKTALAEALCREAAERGALVLVGRCYDLTETPPYGPWVEAVERYPCEPARARLPAPLGSGEAAASQAALFARVRDALAALAAQRPLVVLLDDLHWADPASLDLLRALGRQFAALPLLLLVTYRGDELTRLHALYALLPALAREARAARLDLRRLDADAVRTLVGARYALPAADADRLGVYLEDRAEGHPLYLGELLRTLEEGGLLGRRGDRWALGDLAGGRVPPLLRQVIDGRVARLGEEARRLLTVAAVIGQAVPFALWAAVAGADEDALLGPVERAAEARLLADLPDGGGVRFAHALIREALYEGAGALRRRALHRRVAEALAGLPNPDPDAVAYNFRRAGDPRAVEWLIQAAERAQRAYASLTAAERCEAALALLPDDRAHACERGWLGFHVARLRRYDDPRRGLDHLAEAARLAAETGDAALAAYATAQRGVLQTILGAPRRGLADLEAGVAALGALPPGAAPGLPPTDVTTTPGYYRSQLVIWLAGVGRYGEALAAGEQLVAELAGAATPAGAAAEAAHRARGMAHAALGRPAAAGAEFAAARAALLAGGRQAGIALVAMGEAVWVALPYQADRPAARRALVAEVEEALAREDRGVLADWPQQLNLLPLLLVAGAWAEARAQADTLLALLAGRRAGLLERLVVGAAAELAHAQGDDDRVRRLLEEALPNGPDTPPGDAESLPALALQRLAARRACSAGDLLAARQWLEAHDRWLAWSGSVLHQAEGQLGWAAYRRAAGDLDRAREHGERALALAAEPRQPLALLAAHRLLGELGTQARRHADAAAHLAQALALAEACAAPYERALTLLALAELRAAGGQREEAHTLLGEVRAICAPLGAPPALARAEALATALASAAAPATAYPAGLTAREVAVLRLVAQGLSDAEVAARLYVSVHTVKTHLRAIYTKLDVPSRTAAARVAAELGLT